jgi:hypothetical protein
MLSTRTGQPYRIYIFLTAAIFIFVLGCGAAFYTLGGIVDVWIASGAPTELPADGTSQTRIEVDYSGCSFGGPTDPNGNFSIRAESSKGLIDPTFVSSIDGGVFPPQFILTSDTIPGTAQVSFEVTYCPDGGVSFFGVCSDPTYMDEVCKGNITIPFVEVTASAEDDAAPLEDSIDAQPEEAEQNLSEPINEETQIGENAIDAKAQLYDELEAFLAEEDITAPTPGQIAASGIALSTLLAGWLLLNQLSGISAEESLEAIDAWRRGVRPQESGNFRSTPGFSAEASLEAKNNAADGVGFRPTSVQETGEERALRAINDVQDMDDAVKQTRKDFENFEEKIPQSVKDSEIWKKKVNPKLDKIKKMLKTGELDKARKWLDRSEKLIELRKEVDRDLDHLPDDSREAIVWTERTLKSLGHFAADTYETLVIDPAKSAGKAVLPEEQAKRWNNSMDELNRELSNVAQQIGELPRKGARLMTHDKLMEQADQMMQDSSPEIRQEGKEIKEIHGKWEVPVEKPDFIGKGTRKVEELWNHTMRCLFHDR